MRLSMKPRTFLPALAALALVLASCATGGPAASTTAPAAVPETIDDLPFAVLSWNSPVPGTPVKSPVAGAIKSVETDEFGLSRVAIAVEQPYFWTDGERTCSYELVVGGLESVAIESGPVEAGATLGAMGATPYLAARSPTLDPFLVRSSDELPQDYRGAWWFRPDWLLGRDTAFLSFRPVASFEAAIEDFYRRWAIEGEEPRGSTIHYFPDLDRVRAPFRLDGIPVPAQSSMGLFQAEAWFFRSPGLYVLESRVDLDLPYDATIYWQKGFDAYLRDEYKLGSELWLYGSVVVLDHESRRILFFARDFQLSDDETKVKERLEVIREANAK